MAGRQQNRGDFQPESQWTDEATATILTIKLPGFTKEQLKITFDESSRNLRVEGEEGRRFSRDFKIPEKCKLNEMKAKFDQNTKILTITMPKKNPSPTPQIQKPKQTSTETTQLPSPSPPPPGLINEQLTPAWRDPLGHIKSPSPTPQDTYHLPTPPIPKPTTKTNTKTSNNTTAIPDAPPPAATYQLPPPPSTSSKKEVPDQHTPTTNPRIITPPDTENKSSTTLDETMSRKASPRISPPSEAAAGASLLEKTGAVTKRAVHGGLDEERRLLVNAGVAVLVIAALGVYISYKFGKTTKD